MPVQIVFGSKFLTALCTPTLFSVVILLSCEDFPQGAFLRRSVAMVRSQEEKKEPCKNKISDEILQSTSVKGNDIYDKKKLYYIGGNFFFN